ncbi:MAG TPA: hypothetical protein VGF07_08505, partial [Stellaceae bacterium]
MNRLTPTVLGSVDDVLHRWTVEVPIGPAAVSVDGEPGINAMTAESEQQVSARKPATGQTGGAGARSQIAVRCGGLLGVFFSTIAPIALAAMLAWGHSSRAAPPNSGPGPDPGCADISGRLTANPSSIDPAVSLATTLTWSVDAKDCRAKPIVTLQGLPVALSGHKVFQIEKTTTFFLKLKKEDRDLARATVTVAGDPGIVTVSPGRQVTADDIAKFNAQWMAPYPRQKIIDYAQSTLSQFDIDGAWGTGERMAAMVRMFDLTHDTRYLDHLRELSQIALKYRDDLPLDKDRPDLIRPADQIRNNKVGLPGWGGRAVDSGGLHHVDEITSSLYAYPIAAFARIVAENPSLQTRYSCDGSSDKYCRDAIDYANLMLDTVNFFLPQIHVQRGASGAIEATLTSPEEFRTRPTKADCDKAYDDAEKADQGNQARWSQQRDDCNKRNALAGRGPPHNQNLTFSMVLIELTRVLDSPFYVQSPKRAGGAANTRDFLLQLISR